MKDLLIDGRYRIERKIGQGGFGEVYSGTGLRSGEEVAMKLTHVGNDPEVLRREAEMYKAMADGVGIPRVRWFGEECDFYVLVHELLGPSLEDLFNYCGRTFSLKTILLVADQAISRIKYIHSKSFLHRDIKPENFLMGSGKQGNVLYTIDFGLAKEFCDAERGKSFDGRPLGGTSRYASITNHNGHGRYLVNSTPRSLAKIGKEQSWGSDMESLGYVLLYFARGSLPWQGLKAPTDKERDELIKEKKVSLSGEKLCEGVLPEEFATYINYTRSLRFEDKPDYLFLRQLFHRLFRSKGFSYDHIFDWTEKRFNEIRG